MIELRPCSACHRHVNVADASCPFCGAPAPRAQGHAAVRKARGRRLGSAALFGFGASVVAAGLGACGAQADEGGEAADEEVAGAAPAGSEPGEQVAPGSGGVASPSEVPPTRPVAPSAGTAADPSAEDEQPPARTVDQDMLIEGDVPAEPDTSGADDPTDLDAAGGAPNMEEDITNPVAVYRAPPTDRLPEKG